MFNTYSQNINVNAVSGTLVKNYEKSFFYRFRGDTAKGDKILEETKPSFNLYENFFPSCNKLSKATDLEIEPS